MRLLTTLWTGILAMTCASPALSQTNVGQVLDSGATKLSAAEFRKEIVGRYIVAQGVRGSQEIVYLETGGIRGSGEAVEWEMAGGMGSAGMFSIEGTWVIDTQDRVCQSIRMGRTVLAPRCQFWFKKSDKYFVADSDTDRSARVLVRTLK